MALARRGVEQLERQVHLGRGALDDAERADQRPRHALGADAEVLDRALGLRAPVAVGRRPRSGRRCRSRSWCESCWRVVGWFAVGLGHHFLRKRSSRTTSAPPDLSAGWSRGLPDAVSALAAAGQRACRNAGACRLRAGLRRPAACRRAAFGLSPACAGLGSSSTRPRPPASASVSNCSVNCTDGSANALIASSGTTSRSGNAAERQSDLERLVGDLQVPELMLEHDGHLFRILRRAAGRRAARRRRVVSKVTKK